jgi:digeranylgeranylglycerophospholipid reductase
LEKILEMPVAPEWINATIRRFQFVAPDGTTVYPNVPLVGYVLDRRIFEYDLARMAAEYGAKIVTRAYVNGVILEKDFVCGVTCLIGGEKHQIAANLVIAADGLESRVARWAGLDTHVPLKDMESCCQVTLADVDIQQDTCIFYFSQQLFPGGYAWVFPKGNNMANVGLGIAGHYGRDGSACRRLQSFIEDKFPNASVLYKTFGGVPCARRLPRLSVNGLLVAGDAALQANPISGGGIATGMTGGKLAGTIAAAAIREKNFTVDYLAKYEHEWDIACGNAQKRYYRLKQGISRLTDAQLNKTARVLSTLPPEKQTLVKIFQTALIKQPALIVDILKTLSPFS